MATINFGVISAPSQSAQATVSSPGIQATDLTEAWMALTATADHSTDEMLAEQPNISFTTGAYNTGAGTFVIYGTVRDGLTYGDYKVNWARGSLG